MQREIKGNQFKVYTLQHSEDRRRYVVAVCVILEGLPYTFVVYESVPEAEAAEVASDISLANECGLVRFYKERNDNIRCVLHSDDGTDEIWSRDCAR